ncbi:hypothetical protein SDC9_138136 [bioreactor metagenome]|uniref:Uncharacterized protein n=1 Tax=bioreactor metagenome TaxID=1076179 RepID=A0A645DP06_9ZZZZ
MCHGRNRSADDVAAPFFGDQLVLGQLLLDPFDVGVRLINFIDGNDDGDTGRLCMVDGFYSLRHDAVVRRNDQNGNIGDVGTASPHGGKGRVARGVEEGNFPTCRFDLVGTDVLRDAAGLARRHMGVSNGVKQGGFAVVDVAHDDDNRAAGLKIGLAVGTDVNELLLNGDNHFSGIAGAEFLGHKGGCFVVNGVIGRHH